MTDERGFLTAVAESRNDHTPRLIYADWLDDQEGRQVDAARQRVIAKFPDRKVLMDYAEVLSRTGIGLNLRRVDYIKGALEGFMDVSSSGPPGIPFGVGQHHRESLERYFDQCKSLWFQEEVGICQSYGIKPHRIYLFWRHPAENRHLEQISLSAKYGVIDSVNTAWETWQKVGDRLTMVAPIREVTLRSGPLLDWVVDERERMVVFTIQATVDGHKTLKVKYSVSERVFREWIRDDRGGETMMNVHVVPNMLNSFWPFIQFRFDPVGHYT